MNDAIVGACVRTQCPSLYLCVDADGRVVEANHYSRELLGPHSLGARYETLVADFDATRTPRDLAQLGGVQQVNFVTFAGLPLTLRCVFREVEGRVVVLGSVDAREQETLRRELLQGNQALANLTRELQRSNAELVRLNELRSRFVGMAAHDLRSPLTAISAAASMLEAELIEVSTDQREDLSTLRTSAEFMRRLIDDFLSVALIDAGRLELKRQRVSATALVDGSLRLTAHAATHRGRTLRIEVGDAGALELDVDASRVQQVLMNLVNNAIEHSPEGGTITVRFECEGQRGCFSVSDTGRGVAREVQGDLFKAFVHGSDKTINQRSIGLGLAIAKLVVDAHDGHIGVSSSEAGTTFRVSLPLA